MKNPPILDGAHPLAQMMIKREHELHHHAGREQTVNTLRQYVWMLRLRPTVKTVLRKCTTCAVRRRNPDVPVKGNLPKERLDAYARPFTRCGMDCFGPMWVTIGRRREKRWGLLFTCMVTRAVHIELIAGLSTDSAIMAIRRMAARRGWPRTFMSDNGTNFRGADVELTTAFNDPGAPNQGGAWERLIRSVKRALAVVLHERAPREEVLATLMTEAEHTVNSRPLTHVSVRPEDEEALTPNHFLMGSAAGLPYVGTTDVADRRTWRAAQALADRFWQRWLREYLPTLMPRDDVRRSTANIKPGDMVLIVDGLLPRNLWPRGQVERTYEGPDGVVRSADLTLELTTPWETNIPNDYPTKINKHHDLINKLTKNGDAVNYLIEVEARGPAKSLYNLLKDIGLSRTTKEHCIIIGRPYFMPKLNRTSLPPITFNGHDIDYCLKISRLR
ncbi:uncharacterized protein LOC131851829 [Achroia grisella]|uniref:uncharacterized protein LOC131851829 n=1 Tax=Achroia grisella TaxID=688607 RepID=UPI0027D30DC4|nr:uncharacterized protein LOC131851829 [Achroia grisella]